MIDKLTNCPFCGQGVMIKAEEGWTKDQILQEAIMRCTCDEARHQQEIQDSINEAEAYIKNDLEAADDIREILLRCVEPVGQRRFEKASITAGKARYSVAQNAKGGIKIEKVTTIKETKEN